MTFTTRPELRGTFGMVSSTHWLASAAGMAMLERGGNAFDAAVAAGFVLQVVEPHLNGLGGEVPIAFWDASRRRVEVICGQGVTPRAASIARMRADGVAEIPGSGLLAACVPGAFGAWMTLLADHGRLELADVMAPAIAYAQHGHPVLARVVATIEMAASLFRESWPTSAAVYLAGGVPHAGALLRNPDLASTYTRLVASGASGSREQRIAAARAAFYQGFVAEAIDDHCRRAFVDSSGDAHAGLLTGDDLVAWQARHEDPVTAEYRGWSVAKCGPWSQGPVFLQQLRLLDGFDLRERGFLSVDHVHLVTECAKLAFADREAWYADPDFADVPVATLLSTAYAEQRRALVSDRASRELRPGSPDGRSPRLPTVGAQAVAAGHWTGIADTPVSNLPGDTVHVDAVDREGNMVACTPSGGWLQSSPVIAGLGFCLGTRAQMFNLDESHPNRLEGGKRPRTTLTPSLALFDGKPRLAFGTPGGDNQDQWSLEFFLAHAVFGLDLQAAIDAPMFHTSHFPSSFAPHDAYPGRVHVEARVDRSVRDELRARGHDVIDEDPWSLGRLCAVGRDPERDVLQAAANPRGAQGYAVGR